MIDIGEVEAFLAAAEELHFGRAGERLRLSPSRISQLVRRLEGRVGTRVLERTTRSVVLTPVGERLYRDLLQIYGDLGAALDRARSAGQGLEGVVRVGYLTHCGDEAFERLVAEFRRTFPSCDMSVIDATGSDYLQNLRDGLVDVLLGRFAGELPGDLVQGPVMAREDWVLGVARTHPLAEMLADLRREQGYKRVALRGLDESGVEAMVRTREPKRASSARSRSTERSRTVTWAPSAAACWTALPPAIPAPRTTTSAPGTPGTPASSTPLPPCVVWRWWAPASTARRPATSLIGARSGKVPSGPWTVS